MKTIAFLFLMTFLLVNCSDETLAPEVNISDMVDMDAMLIQSGGFMNGPYGSVMGTAELFANPDNTFDVLLKDFDTSNGPDLYVYLSKEVMPVNFVSLGKLKSTMGNQVYPITGMPDFSEYKYICIHCKEYNHLFGYALIK